ncbi:MAG: hypothetical protein JW719_04145 [Pirellulales bacterium]|nr:hypothetical protein [Pirellulales bacterium]
MSQVKRREEQPTYWFVLLEIARERGDFESAAEASRQLRRLGVSVRYLKRADQ